MKNTLKDLRNYMFEQMERLNDDDLTQEALDEQLKKAEGMTKIASVIVNTADLEFKAIKYVNEFGNNANLPEVLGIEAK